jgi:flagellar basal-body rod protein FlgG
MLDSLYVGAAGMYSQQLNVEAIANNLANVNTVAFKKSRVAFQELFYREANRSSAAGADGIQSGATSAPFGAGVAVGNVERMFTAGEIKKSDAPLDVAISGTGFFEVTLPDGSNAYTRVGSFQVNRDGMLATSDGNLLHPSIQVPENAVDVQIDTTGLVTMANPSPTANGSTREELGQIDLITFPNQAGLKPLGTNLFIPTERSGDAVVGKPGIDGVGTLTQGYLEASNVTLIDELTHLMIAQRAYEANSKVVQASDDMMSITNNLRR